MPSTMLKSEMIVERLRCEYLTDPLGIDVLKPRLGWVLRSEERGQKQTAYQVLVAATPEALAKDQGDLWDSGNVESDQTIHVEYAGKALGTRMRCCWKVRVWDKAGQPSAWSRSATWTMGLLKASDWGAKWIAFAPDPGRPDQEKAYPVMIPATMVRKEFDMRGPVKRAIVSVTGLGLYELRINGRRVGDHLLAPEWTCYRKRIQYQTYDVTDLLHAGHNAIGAQLNGGWWISLCIPFVGQTPLTNEQFCLLMRLDVELTDGSTHTIVTDSSWKATTEGPIRRAGIYFGETYDATKEIPGWDQPDFAAVGWSPAQVLPYPSGMEKAALVAQCNEPIHVVKELQPLKMTEPKPGVYIFDLGQNMVGWCRLKASAATGTRITLRHAEMLNEDGTLYTANLRTAAQVNEYIWGGGEAILEPHFTYYGFRYVEITGLPSQPAPDAILGRVFHSAAPDSGQFSCSNELINKIMHCVEWGQRGNLHGVPTDCPQRDERMGWTGDIQAFSQMAIFNMDLAGFFTKWMADMRDAQLDDGRFLNLAPHPADPNYLAREAHREFGAAWSDAGTVIPWRVYQNYADIRMLQQHFESAKRWIEFIHRYNPDRLWLNNRGGDYGDWLNGDTVVLEGYPPGISAVPKELFATAFFAYSTEIVAKMARVLGRKDDAARYGKLFEEIKAAFNKEFVTDDGRIKGDTQAGYALALHFNLLNESLRSRATERLLEAIKKYKNHNSTGFQAAHRMMFELTRTGHHDEAYRLINLRTVPSWGYMVDMGATTIWERWDGYVKGRGFQNPDMNSYNHWAFGSVGEWVWRELAGINPDEDQPGYKHFLIRPRPCGDLIRVKARYDSIRGPIMSEWRIFDGQFHLHIEIPANTTATVFLPTRSADEVTEGDLPAIGTGGVKFLRLEDTMAVFGVGSGRYNFQSNIHP